ncbi:MAG TPA: hemerythrin domain-containing protein [Nitrospira sp.]|nr:hemerythrin domain-containing protein [Nitrospira sp.]
MGSNARDILRDEHRTLESLFRRFDEVDVGAREDVAEAALLKLEVHSNVEEDVIYPTIRAAIADKDMIDEAIEEHHAMSLLARELRKLPASDPRYKAKFHVLAKFVSRHLEEEEQRTFPEAENAGLDWSALTLKKAAEVGDKVITQQLTAKQESSAARTHT